MKYIGLLVETYANIALDIFRYALETRIDGFDLVQRSLKTICTHSMALRAIRFQNEALLSYHNFFLIPEKNKFFLYFIRRILYEP